MELYEVLEKRRTYRDYSDREVSDEITCASLNSSWCADAKTSLK